MILLLGSLRMGLLAMIPNLTPVVTTLGVMGWLDLPLDASTILIGAIIIGILDKGLNQAEVHYSSQYIVKGIVILAAVYLDVRRE